MHWATLVGHVEAGVEVVVGPEPPPTHLVQTVDVEVRVTVEAVWVVTVDVIPPEVMVLVTGQLVTVV